MTKRIVKYQLIETTVKGITGLKAGDFFKIEMVKGARVLTAMKEENINQLLQQLQICATIWCEIDSEEIQTEQRTFTLLQGNEDYRVNELIYISSFQVAPMVQTQHLFEVIPNPFQNEKL